MKAKIVVGLGFGDCGKGLMTDYLSATSTNPIVIRYTGGHQAGHTVVKDGIRHINASLGSGSLRNVPTYISDYCCFYPPNLLREYNVLKTKVENVPKIYINPRTIVTTPYDVAYNRLMESRLNHGSCGMGIGATMSRNEGAYKLFAIDLQNPMVLEEKLKQIKNYYELKVYDEVTTNYFAKERKQMQDKYLDTVESEMKYFRDAILSVPYYTRPYEFLKSYDTLIFEGAQGVLLDRDFGVFPNVTYGYTTSRNALEICKRLNVDSRLIDIYYITRCYSTRHGNGWMPEGEVKLIKNEDETNIFNEYQGNFRTAELDYDLLRYAIECDNSYSADLDKKMVVTCLDQRPDFVFDKSRFPEMELFFGSYSPDSTSLTSL